LEEEARAMKVGLYLVSKGSPRRLRVIPAQAERIARRCASVTGLEKSIRRPKVNTVYA